LMLNIGKNMTTLVMESILWLVLLLKCNFTNKDKEGSRFPGSLPPCPYFFLFL
jgi:hypothetical protein